jgi:hypothetical protein
MNVNNSVSIQILEDGATVFDSPTVGTIMVSEELFGNEVGVSFFDTWPDAFEHIKGYLDNQDYNTLGVGK